MNLDLKHNLSPVFYCFQWPIYPSYDWAHGLSDAIEADVEMGTGIMMIFLATSKCFLESAFHRIEESPGCTQALGLELKSSQIESIRLVRLLITGRQDRVCRKASPQQLHISRTVICICVALSGGDPFSVHTRVQYAQRSLECIFLS